MESVKKKKHSSLWRRYVWVRSHFELDASSVIFLTLGSAVKRLEASWRGCKLAAVQLPKKQVS